MFPNNNNQGVWNGKGGQQAYNNGGFSGYTGGYGHGGFKGKWGYQYRPSYPRPCLQYRPYSAPSC
eukprot:9893711-Karenia_brevis.AAC.1